MKLKKKLVGLTTKLDSIEAKTYKSYRTKALRILKAHGFVACGDGAYATAYRNAELGCVVKVLYDDGTKFHKRYPEGYLKPVYRSENGGIAIQPIATTVRELEARQSKMNDEADKLQEQIRQLNKRLIETQRDLAVTTYNLERITSENIPHHNRIGDIHEENIGLFEDRVVMFDLNSQFKSPYLKKNRASNLLTMGT